MSGVREGGLATETLYKTSIKIPRGRAVNRRISKIEYRMSKEGILSILSRKIERSDAILDQLSFDIFIIFFGCFNDIFYCCEVFLKTTHKDIIMVGAGYL